MRLLLPAVVMSVLFAAPTCADEVKMDEATKKATAKALSWLATRQNPDGSWHVKTRSIWVQPYFESGFPHSQDQFISSAGTAWATMALSMTIEMPRLSSRN